MHPTIPSVVVGKNFTWKVGFHGLQNGSRLVSLALGLDLNIKK